MTWVEEWRSGCSLQPCSCSQSANFQKIPSDISNRSTHVCLYLALSSHSAYPRLRCPSQQIWSMVQECIGSWNVHTFSCKYFTQTFTGYALKSEICTKFFISFTPTSLQFTASNFHKGLHKFLHKIYNMNSPQILLFTKFESSSP